MIKVPEGLLRTLTKRAFTRTQWLEGGTCLQPWWKIAHPKLVSICKIHLFFNWSYNYSALIVVYTCHHNSVWNYLWLLVFACDQVCAIVGWHYWPCQLSVICQWKGLCSLYHRPVMTVHFKEVCKHFTSIKCSWLELKFNYMFTYLWMWDQKVNWFNDLIMVRIISPAYFDWGKLLNIISKFLQGN